MIKSINHFTFAVSDLEKSFRFYLDLLGLKPVAKWKNGAYFLAGDTWLALNLDEKVTSSARNDYSHIAFTCRADEFVALKNRLLDYGCREWSVNQSEGDSFYFTDPDGHKLEIHVGDLNTRLKEMRDHPRADFEFFP